MSIVVRKVGGREYAYEAHRQGARMVQSYIGPLARPEVARRVRIAREAVTVPAHTLRLFSTAPSVQRDAGALIRTVLEQGDLEDVRWMMLAYPVSTIVDVLLAADLPAETRNFWLVWFEVRGAS